jgi:hypothetical protein
VSFVHTALGRLAVVGAAAVSIAVTVASPAFAVTFVGRDLPYTSTLAPGSTGQVSWIYQNTGGPGTLPADGMSVVFTAPGDTTFPPQATVPSQYNPGPGGAWRNNNVGLRNCVLGNANTTLSCEAYGINGGQSGWPTGAAFQFSPQVTVSPTAAKGTTLPQGGGSFYFAINGTPYSITDGTLNVATPPPSGTGMCLNAPGKSGGHVILAPCADQPGQRFEISGSKLKLADTVGTANEMCLGTYLVPKNGAWIYSFPCAGTADQDWVLTSTGQFVLGSTLGSSPQMCLDTGTRDDKSLVVLWACGATSNQAFQVSQGQIELLDT